jgi:hypothetical protein
MDQHPKRVTSQRIDLRTGFVSLAGLLAVGLLATVFVRGRMIAGAGAVASDPPASETPATSIEPGVIFRSLDPRATPQPEITPEPIATATPFASAIPAALSEALDSANWVLPGTDGAWVGGNYSGRRVRIELSGLATINVHGAQVTAVDPVDGMWVFYAVDPKGGHVTELLRLPEAQPTIYATRSADGQRLFFHSGAAGVDGGIDMVDLSTKAVTQLVAGGDTPDRQRRFLVWSVSGRTLYSMLCALEDCKVDVIDPEKGTVRRLPKLFGAVSGSDKFALGYTSAVGPNRPWELYDLSTDTTQVIAKKWIGETEEGFAIGGDAFLVAGWSPDGATYNIVVVDGATGVERLVTSQSGKEDVQRLQHYMISENWAAVMTSATWDSLIDRGAPIDVIDINNGDLLPAVGNVTAP